MAFAAIVAGIDDPERRRFRRVAVGLCSGLLAGGVVVFALVLRWPLVAVLSFVVAYVLGLIAALPVMTRRMFGTTRWPENHDPKP